MVKTQGRHGEVAAEMHSDVPGRFAEGMKLFALPKAEDVRRELEVEDLWPHKGLLVLKFRGVDSMSDAELLIGSELQVPAAERAGPGAGLELRERSDRMYGSRSRRVKLAELKMYSSEPAKRRC